MNLFYSRACSIITKAQAFLFLMILLVISVLNKFPRGYIYSWTDFYQLVNFGGKHRWFTGTLVDTNLGNVNYLYVPFYYSFLGLVQNFVGPQNMSVVYSFTFLAGAFLSFYIAILFYGIDKKKNRTAIFCFSLLYAVNSYTATRFTTPSIFFLPYIFIPFLFATVHAYFTEATVLSRNLLWCAVAMLASLTCWAGPPFFVAYCILSFIYIGLIVIFCRSYNMFIFIKKITLFCFMFFSSFAIYLLTWPVLLLNSVSDLHLDKYPNKIVEWLYSQSLSIIDVFSFRILTDSLIVNINKINYAFFITFCFSLFFLFAFSLLSFPKNRLKKTLIVFDLMVLTIIFLLNKGKGFPWEAFTHSLFTKNIILSSLRSFDKLLIFLPFFLLMPFCLYSANARQKVVPVAILLVTFICTYPIIYGGLNKIYFAVEKGKNFQTSRCASLVKIPQEYFDQMGKINRIKTDFKIFSAPWSLENPDTHGWTNFTKWKTVGVSPLTQYFKQPLVQMNEPLKFRGWNYGMTWNKQGNSESFWLMPFSGMLNAKYLFFQKDVSQMFVSQAVSKIIYYKGKGFIKLLASNPYFDFFEISDTYFLPHFYVPDRLYIVEKPNSIPFALKNAFEPGKPAILESYNGYPTDMVLNHGGVVIEYKKINPAKYKVKFHGITKSFPLVFSEAFYSFWRIYPKRYIEAKSRAIETYKIFEDNEAYQATKEELKTYLKEGWVSELGGGGTKTRKETLWASFDSPQPYKEKYVIDFISKKMKGVIQNDNISDGHFYDMWSLGAIDEKFHRIANGYANYWQIDLEYLKKKFPGMLKENSDGSYDLEVIIEFWPQKVLNISRIYSLIFAIIILVLLISSFVLKKDEYIPQPKKQF